MFRVVDELDEAFRGKFIRQALHALAAGGPHSRNLRHRQWTNRRNAAHETKGAAAPAGDEAGLLPDRPYPEEALCDLEHQLGNRLSLAMSDWCHP